MRRFASKTLQIEFAGYRMNQISSTGGISLILEPTPPRSRHLQISVLP
jgi:hypothetical protein